MKIDSTYLPCLLGYIVMCVGDAARRKEFEVPKTDVGELCALRVSRCMAMNKTSRDSREVGFQKGPPALDGLGSMAVPASGNAFTAGRLSVHTIVETSGSMLPIYGERHVGLTS